MVPDQAKHERVRSYFNKPSLYLKSTYQIAVRSQQVKQLLGDLRGATIADIGCGDGSVSLPFVPENQVTFVDAADGMLERAVEQVPTEYRDHAEFVCSDVMDFDPERSYDVLLFIGVLAHVEDVPKTIRKLGSLVRPDGKLVIQITDFCSLIGFTNYVYTRFRNAFSRSIRHSVNRLCFDEVLRRAKESGFTYVNHCTNWSLLPGMGAMSQERLYRYTIATGNNRFLRRFGSEIICVLRKN